MASDALDGYDFEPLNRLRRDLRKTMDPMSIRQARALVDAFYAVQDFRIQANNQRGQAAAHGEAHEVVDWLAESLRLLEDNIERALDVFTSTETTGMGVWLRSIVGIGPVLAAGLLAHVDVTRQPTVGHLWSFAGLNPEARWERGSKRPWNARLKLTCWKISNSIVTTRGHANSYYGPLYDQRKAYETERNLAGYNSALAAERLAANPNDERASSWKLGQLPPAHVEARARRWTVKLFLAHFWQESYRRHYGTEPPLPYPITFLGHIHVIPDPAGQ
jgi:hypothetical protein